jgi:predicted HTH domain antitoxin
MSTVEAAIAELKCLPPAKQAAAARYIHELKVTGYRSERLSLALAIGLFVSGDTTLGQAAEVAGLSHGDFLRELGQRRIPIHYGAEELVEDLRAVEALVR